MRTSTTTVALSTLISMACLSTASPILLLHSPSLPVNLQVPTEALKSSAYYHPTPTVTVPDVTATPFVPEPNVAEPKEMATLASEPSVPDGKDFEPKTPVITLPNAGELQPKKVHGIKKSVKPVKPKIPEAALEPKVPEAEKYPNVPEIEKEGEPEKEPRVVKVDEEDAAPEEPMADVEMPVVPKAKGKVVRIEKPDVEQVDVPEIPRVDKGGKGKKAFIRVPDMDVPEIPEVKRKVYKPKLPELDEMDAPKLPKVEGKVPLHKAYEIPSARSLFTSISFQTRSDAGVEKRKFVEHNIGRSHQAPTSSQSPQMVRTAAITNHNQFEDDPSLLKEKEYARQKWLAELDAQRKEKQKLKRMEEAERKEPQLESTRTLPPRAPPPKTHQSNRHAAQQAEHGGDFFWASKDRASSGGGGDPVRDRTGTIVTSRRRPTSPSSFSSHPQPEHTYAPVPPPTSRPPANTNLLVSESTSTSELTPSHVLPAPRPTSPAHSSYGRIRSQFSGEDADAERRRKEALEWRETLRKQVEEKELRKLEEKMRAQREELVDSHRWEEESKHSYAHQQKQPDQRGGEGKRNGAGFAPVAIAAEENQGGRHQFVSGASTPSIRSISRIPVLKASPSRAAMTPSEAFSLPSPPRHTSRSVEPDDYHEPSVSLASMKPPAVPRHAASTKPAPEFIYEEDQEEDPERSRAEKRAPERRRIPERSPSKKLENILKNAKLNHRGLGNGEEDSRTSLYESVTSLKKNEKKNVKKPKDEKGRDVAFGRRMNKPDLTPANRFQTDKSKFAAPEKVRSLRNEEKKVLPKIGSHRTKGSTSSLVDDPEVSVIKSDHFEKLRKSLKKPLGASSNSKLNPQKPKEPEEESNSQSPRRRRLVKPAPADYAPTPLPPSSHTLPVLNPLDSVPAAGLSSDRRQHRKSNLHEENVTSPNDKHNRNVRPPWGLESDNTQATDSRRKVQDKFRPPWGTEEDVPAQPLVKTHASAPSPAPYANSFDGKTLEARSNVFDETPIRPMKGNRMAEVEENRGPSNEGIRSRAQEQPIVDKPTHRKSLSNSSNEDRVRQQALNELMSFGNVLEEERRKVQRDMSFFD
ncbi:hypothetical protein HDV05_000706 [Chytridiales sp. JEL 0842]|nr:hypothetical protein HDV05_000706 [Chytridiales sp. JEL 0842]